MSAPFEPRPVKSRSPKDTSRPQVNVRLWPAEIEKLRALSEKSGVTMSEFVRGCILERLERDE